METFLHNERKGREVLGHSRVVLEAVLATSLGSGMSSTESFVLKYILTKDTNTAGIRRNVNAIQDFVSKVHLINFRFFSD